MKAHAHRPQAKHRSALKRALQRRIDSEPAVHVVGSRPEATAQINLQRKVADHSAPSTRHTIQRKIKEAVIIKDTVTRKRGVRKSLVHGIPGRVLEQGDKIAVHDNKIFYSRLQTDKPVDYSYRGNDVSTAWNRLADAGDEYVRYDAFRFSDIKDFLEDNSSDDSSDDEDSFYPFSGAELIFTTDNPDICEEMVTLWIAKRGRLEGYVNATLGEIPVVTNELPSRFHEKARAIPKDVKATKESDYIGHLHEKYPQGTKAPHDARYLPVSQLLAKVTSLPSGGMMHVSIRKDPIHSGGHAVGFARMKTKFYLFDPGTGVAQLSVGRLEEVLFRLFASADISSGVLQGDWASYKLFYAVTIPDARFRGLRKY